MTNYQELLSDKNWMLLRWRILSEYKSECQHCSNESYIKNNSLVTCLESSLHRQIIDFTTDLVVAQNTYEIKFDFDSDKLVSYLYNIGQLDIDQESSIYVDISNKEHPVVQAIRNGSEWIYVRNINIHHKYYQDGQLPWEYPDSALEVLCWECHINLHSKMKVPWLDKNGLRKGDLTPCSRCGGAGIFPEYRHVQNGICFQCNGARFIELV